MQTINLKKYYYPLCRQDTYLTVSDEVAEALLLMRREENNHARKVWYHKAYFSLDCEDGIENEAIGWAQPSPEDYVVEKEEQAERAELIRRVYEALATLTPLQARRIHARYMSRTTLWTRGCAPTSPSTIREPATPMFISC